jgi:magnesium transporter
MIRSKYLKQTGEIISNLDVNQYPDALADESGLLWVDFEATPPELDEPILRMTFDFHPLAIDDALQESHVPKIDDWDDYLYIVLHSMIFEPDNEDRVDTREVDFFLGRNYLVTHHDQTILAIDQVWAAFERDERLRKKGVGHLFYRLADEIVASYMPVVEALDDEIDQAEHQVFDDPTPYTLEKIFRLKRAILHLRRIIGPQREVLNRLARDEYQVIGAKERVYFRDIYDHLVRLFDITESVRDLVSGTLDTYLSVINNRMNDIMKTLTIITTLFMPLSFLTGFFGMNFFQPTYPFGVWTGRLAFGIVWLLVILTPLIMFAWMRRRRWM